MKQNIQGTINETELSLSDVNSAGVLITLMIVEFIYAFYVTLISLHAVIWWYYIGVSTYGKFTILEP